MQKQQICTLAHFAARWFIHGKMWHPPQTTQTWAVKILLYIGCYSLYVLCVILGLEDLWRDFGTCLPRTFSVDVWIGWGEDLLLLSRFYGWVVINSWFVSLRYCEVITLYSVLHPWVFQWPLSIPGLFLSIDGFWDMYDRIMLPKDWIDWSYQKEWWRSQLQGQGWKGYFLQGAG